VEALSHSMEEVEGGPVDESVREAHKQKLTESIAKIGENIQLGDYCHWMGDAQSTIAYYIHHNGKIGVGVELTSSKIATELSELAKKISLHIAAASPEYLDPASVPEAVIQKEREIYTDQMKESGKPMPVIEKIVEGKIAKFYEDRCVMNQKYALDPDHSIPSMLEDVSKKIGAPVAFKRFARFMIGE